LLTLFFANTHQDLSQFVLDDLGLHQFEKYQLSKERRFFDCREQIEQLLQLSQITQLYNDADRKQLAVLEQCYQLIPSSIEHNYIERKRQHLINDIARDFERIGEYARALELFRTTHLPPTRERQARILDKLDHDETFSDIVTEMVTHPVDLAEYEVATKLEQRVRRKQGEKVARTSKPKCHEYRLELDLSTQRVELAAKDYFEQQGWQVFYAENSFLNGLFGLAFWDVIFAPVEGAFLNAYQYKPLDLYHSDFQEKRQDVINSVFTQMGNEGLAHLKARYREKFNVSNPFVHWAGFEFELLEAALETIPLGICLSFFMELHLTIGEIIIL